MYVPVVTLSKEWQETFRTITIRFRSQMIIQPQNNNLNYLIDPTLTKINRLCAFPFVRNAEGDQRDSFSLYYVPNVKIK